MKNRSKVKTRFKVILYPVIIKKRHNNNKFKKLILFFTLFSSMKPKVNNDKLFYKYQPITKYLFENLKCNQLYFNDPRMYNDPFDSRVSGYSEYTEEQWIKQCMKAHPGLNMDQAMQALKWNIDTGNWKKSGNIMRLENSYTDQPPLTCCFCKKPNNILMWSHYADYHKGICLRFKPIYEPVDEPELNGFEYITDYLFTINSRRIPLFKVKYSGSMPSRVKWEQTYDIRLFDFLLTKSKCWKYEEEYRLILDDYLIDKKCNFKKEELEGIIFGLRTSYHNARRIYNIVKKNYEGIPINFYKASEIKNKYAIKIKYIADISKELDQWDNKNK